MKAHVVTSSGHQYIVVDIMDWLSAKENSKNFELVLITFHTSQSGRVSAKILYYD